MVEQIIIDARRGGKKHNITYRELFDKFMELNSNLKSEIVDYRPYGDLTIILYFKSGASMLVTYEPLKETFEILHV